MEEWSIGQWAEHSVKARKVRCPTFPRSEDGRRTIVDRNLGVSPYRSSLGSVTRLARAMPTKATASVGPYL
jgi:hypothetical protein